MRIGVMGTACVGKSTFIRDFIANWNMYKICEKPRYTDLVKEKGIKLNEDGNEESQRLILNTLIDQIIGTSKKDNIIYDRTVLDNLVYTLWLNAKEKVSDSFVKESIKLIRESLVFYDILFFLPITRQSPIKFVPAEHRTTSPEYRLEIDNIFKALIHQYNKTDNTFFPFDTKIGCPAIIEIFGTPELRIELAKQYINKNGKAIDGGDNNLFLLDDPVITDFK
ncbi:MAG: AAA family ATPase [Clostridia bacterium]|nr:AAA family ATPase [Clostridia bacterium]